MVEDALAHPYLEQYYEPSDEVSSYSTVSVNNVSLKILLKNKEIPAPKELSNKEIN